MKKLFAGILAGALILSSMSVFAGETEQEITEINWEDMVAANEQSDNDLIGQGDFVNFDEIAVQMWVPNVLQPVELTDEDKEMFRNEMMAIFWDSKDKARKFTPKKFLED